jgi:hypothetical protein
MSTLRDDECKYPHTNEREYMEKLFKLIAEAIIEMQTARAAAICATAGNWKDALAKYN